MGRANYAYGLLRAADVAAYFGHKKVTVCEFGVASGVGLMNMIALADSFTREPGVEYRIVGFDTGKGLPQVKGYKDHAELWVAGDFEMEDRETIQQRIAEKVRRSQRVRVTHSDPLGS